MWNKLLPQISSRRRRNWLDWLRQVNWLRSKRALPQEEGDHAQIRVETEKELIEPVHYAFLLPPFRPPATPSSNCATIAAAFGHSVPPAAGSMKLTGASSQTLSSASAVSSGLSPASRASTASRLAGRAR